MKATHEIFDALSKKSTGMKWDKGSKRVLLGTLKWAQGDYEKGWLERAGYFLKPIKPMQMENK